MKHALISYIALLVALVAGCNGEKPAAEAPRPMVNLGHLSLEGMLDQLQTPKERADLIHKWIDARVDPKMMQPAVKKYVNDPDPDVAAAAKEALGGH